MLIYLSYEFFPPWDLSISCQFCIPVFFLAVSFKTLNQNPESVLTVLKVIQQLPEGLAIRVLADLRANLDLQLYILPASLHHLAIEAAFPSIRRHHSLTLDFDKLTPRMSTAEAVMQAVNTATSSLQTLCLENIPVRNNKRLLQLIATACRSALDVTLSAGNPDVLARNEMQPDISRLDCIFRSSTGLQSLSLAVEYGLSQGRFRGFAAPSCISNLQFLTHSCLGRGFHHMDLPQIVPHMTSLQSLYINRCELLQLPPLCPLTRLQSLKLRSFHYLRELPSLPTLAPLQRLELRYFHDLYELPPLSMLTALQTLILVGCGALREVPPLDTLASLHELNLAKCPSLKQVPSLHSVTALQTLQLCELAVQCIPPLDTLPALQTLELNTLGHIGTIPSLATLTALQTLHIEGCWRRQQLPPLATLTALQTLKVWRMHSLLKLAPLSTLTALQTLVLSGCSQLQGVPCLDPLTALRTLDLSGCKQLLELPPLDRLTALQTLNIKGCGRVQQSPPMEILTRLQTFEQ
jgi:Leucine-rich repeat (LRR) protein